MNNHGILRRFRIFYAHHGFGLLDYEFWVDDEDKDKDKNKDKEGKSILNFDFEYENDNFLADVLVNMSLWVVLEKMKELEVLKKMNAET